MKIFSLSLLITSVLLLTCHSPRQNEHENSITVFCAAGISPAINEFTMAFDSLSTGSVRINIGSSGTLARQIEQGNSADIYISANTRWANYIVENGNFNNAEAICRNRLVFIAPAKSKLDTLPLSNEFNPTLAFEGYLSLGDPEHVPAGEYALQALNSLHWTSLLEDRFLPAQNVRASIRPVEMGECELGITYLSEAFSSKKVKIVALIPDSLHEPIKFQALLAKETSSRAKQFYTQLIDPRNRALWEKYGFSTVY